MITPELEQLIGEMKYDFPEDLDTMSIHYGITLALAKPELWKSAKLVSWPVVEQAFCLGFLAIEGATVEELSTIKEKWERAKQFLETMQEEHKL